MWPYKIVIVKQVVYVSTKQMVDSSLSYPQFFLLNVELCTRELNAV